MASVLPSLQLCLVLVMSLTFLLTPGEAMAKRSDQSDGSVGNIYEIVLQNLLRTIEENARKYEERLLFLEKAAAERMAAMNDVIHDLRGQVGELQQTVATQTLAETHPEVRNQFDVSSQFRGKHYLVSKKARPFNNSAADATCQEFGGYLAELDDQEEFDFVFEYVKAMDGSRQYAVGDTDIAQEGSFVFYHSQQAVTSSFWGEGEPNNLHGNENCCSVSPSRGGMNDMPCDLRVKYICEITL